MLCISPLSIPRPNGSGQRDRITVPCGKCLPCLSNKRQDWVLRLKQELKVSKSAKFVTLTYEDKFTPVNEDGILTLRKSDVQLYLKRLRKVLPGEKIRYFVCGEYGPQTCRPHYHGLFFNMPVDRVDLFDLKWKKGFVKIGSVTDQSIQYVTKYVLTKSEFPENCEKPFLLMSTRKGIGCSYVVDSNINFHKDLLLNSMIELGGVHKRLPRYYRDKIFNDVEKERINEKILENADKNWRQSIDKYSSEREYFATEEEKIRQNIERMKKSIVKSAKI